MQKKKQKLVLNPDSKIKQLTKKELEKVGGGWTCVPKQPDNDTF